MSIRKALTFILIAALFLPFAGIVAVYHDSYRILTHMTEYRPYVSTRIYDRKGRLVSELFDENRTFISLDRIPLHVRQAFITAEDKNFYRHTGIDVTGIMRALLIDIVRGDFTQGGSTITQQLVKQIYTGTGKTLWRKTAEIIVARHLERKLDKDRILELYLNQIYFGHGVYGIASAASFYLGKKVSDLDIVEAALLSSIQAAPNRFSPLRNPSLAWNRHKQVLYEMAGTGHISRSNAAEAFNLFWDDYRVRLRLMSPTMSIRSRKYDCAPFFTEHIRRILVDKYGPEQVYRGGLKIYTTLDLDHQKAAVSALKSAIKIQNRKSAATNRRRLRKEEIRLLSIARGKAGRGRLQAGHTGRFFRRFRETSEDSALLLSLLFSMDGASTAMGNYREFREGLLSSSRVEGALVSIDVKTGGITAMVGGSDFNSRNQLNRAAQSRRQPGSAFKPFVYAAAIQSRKITAASPFTDLPIVFNERKKIWSPSNYGREFHGRVLARRGLAISLNIVSVLIYDRTGGKRIAGLASRMTGVPLSRFEIDPTLALGTTEMTPLELASGYAAFASGGVRREPGAIEYILDRDANKIYNRQDREHRVMSREAAFIMTDMLRDVVDRGTGYSAVRKQAGFRSAAAGKTGTTSRFRDAWFAGFTPDLAAAVWIGCDSPIFSLGPGQSGAVAAAPAWGTFMKAVCKGKKAQRFSRLPRGVIQVNVCAKTGMLPAKGCPAVREYFITGTEPKDVCDSRHSDMVSIFELARKRKDLLIESENSGVPEKAIRKNSISAPIEERGD